MQVKESMLQSESNIDFEMKVDEESSSNSTENNIRINSNNKGSLVVKITDKELGELGKQVFKESDEEFIKRVKEASPYGGLKTWQLSRLIIKSNDDLRSEQFAMQVIETIDSIF